MQCSFHKLILKILENNDTSSGSVSTWHLKQYCVIGTVTLLYYIHYMNLI